MQAQADKLLRGLNWLESAAAALAYALVAGLLIADVVGREVFGNGVFGAQKMAVYGAVVAGFLGLSLATAKNSHLRPSFLDFVIQNDAIERVGDFFSAAFFLAMAYIGGEFVQQSFEYADRAAVLYWLLWPIQLVIPYAFVSTSLRHLIFGLYPELKAGSAPEEKH